ncbi:ABC transporter permease [Kribbella sandramycini]|uniref:ABC transporter permease n=1 Tax=Kribbella sandramycini TaxID=60450 RepID=A0A7Y4NXM8_9ACTN|nr:ABC transporter permease [Kribbella sandramycini]MBB6568514.1 ABC-2 type transport system permease protein [Kribbella sandramycini]NOL38898.1 ABC transporter permease [Kribbella sandramycini]
MSTATAAPRRTSPYVAVLRAEARLMSREPGILFWAVGFPPLLLVILGLIPAFREPSAGLGGLRTIDVYVPVLVLTAIIMTGLQTMPPVITGYRERGILRRMSTTPVRPAALLSAQMVLTGGIALGSAIVCLLIGRLVYDVRLPQQPIAYTFALLLTTAGALAFGALITAVARTAKVAAAIGSAVFFPSLACAGMWLPVQAMPDLMARIVTLTPFGAAAQALGDAATGAWPAWSDLGVVAAWALVLSAAAMRWFRWQ